MDGQGASANRHGRAVEDEVALILKLHKFDEVIVQRRRDHIPDWAGVLPERLGQRGLLPDESRGVYVRQANVYRGIHGRTVTEDFLLFCPEWPDLLGLSLRQQHSSGSVLEKLEHLYANIWECSPFRCMVLLDGPSFHDGVKQRNQTWAGRSAGKIARWFYSTSEFRLWIMAGAVYPPEFTGLAM